MIAADCGVDYDIPSQEVNIYMKHRVAEYKVNELRGVQLCECLFQIIDNLFFLVSPIIGENED